MRVYFLGANFIVLISTFRYFRLKIFVNIPRNFPYFINTIFILLRYKVKSGLVFHLIAQAWNRSDKRMFNITYFLTN
ncbi:hypothetical protein M621_14830 [Serratia plymuthica S13]|uniref:Uncharacterized protein n=1 Tax=Serratia plymuthica S13 TaxID=1348660 RepID=S4YWY4_SERPL|nr:hypothetical protein M621_14830 [Serratia plymuthica S13]